MAELGPLHRAYRSEDALPKEVLAYTCLSSEHLLGQSSGRGGISAARDSPGSGPLARLPASDQPLA